MTQQTTSQVLQDALAGLSAEPRTLDCKYFYDARGSELFDEITDTPEYYPTRTEVGIMTAHSADIAAEIGSGARIVEFGSGSGLKTRLLLEALDAPASYTPVEISQTALEQSVTKLRAEFPGLRIVPFAADYTQQLELDLPKDRRIVFFPGSTIGNFTRDEARDFIGRASRFVGKDGGLLIGVDLKKDPNVLHAAYNDAAGVTAEFNLNLLRRLNREAGADFDLSQWSHYAHYAPEPGRIEVYIVSLADQVVRMGGQAFEFAVGDPIRTEYSHKYNPSEFEDLAHESGFALRSMWTDAASWFGVFYFVVE